MKTGSRTRRRSSRQPHRYLAGVSAAMLAATGLLVAGGAPATAAERVDNPYEGAEVYVNPIWAANAAAEPGGDAVADEPTGVWLDRISAIHGNDSPTTGSFGLRDHLDEALAQNADLVQVVIYNLPGRDCAALASNGELGPDELGRYESEYIDPIAEILSEPAYAELRIVTTIEIDSLPNLITNVGSRETATENCDEMLANGNYVNGVGYALAQLGAIPNVYNYVDAGHHGWIGWEDNFEASAEIMFEAANANGAQPSDVHGFIANTANYSALVEPHFDVDDVVNGQPVRENSSWIDWNSYVDELSFAQAFRQQAVEEGFQPDIGMLIDTSRNGWGGPNRPDGPGPTTSADAYVDGGRIDRRIQTGNWCNQEGAGLGERPQANPASGIDAYVWMKPPGESDGSSEEIPNDEGKGFDRMCDPTYGGNPRNGNNMSGALPNAPVSGHWFSAQFQQLLQNAHPPIGSDSGGPGDPGDPGDPAAECSVDYGVQSQWNNGYVAQVTVRNTSGSNLSSWTLRFTNPNGQQVTSSWNATVSQQGDQVTATGSGWNGGIPAGGSVSFGFQGTLTGAHTTPSGFTLNASTCD